MALHEQDGPGNHQVLTSLSDHWDTNPSPASSELCQSRPVLEWDCDVISAGEGPPAGPEPELLGCYRHPEPTHSPQAPRAGSDPGCTLVLSNGQAW